MDRRLTPAGARPALAFTDAPVKPKYCYWSVCDGAYGAMMEHCVLTARQAGVFKEFHVLCDRALEGCECYDAYQIEKTSGLFKLHYLKVGMNRLNFDYFVWIDADTVFLRNPIDVLSPLGKSPMHVPLEANLSAFIDSRSRRAECDSSKSEIENPKPKADPVAPKNSDSLNGLHDLFRQGGIVNPVYLCGSAFWIAHHDAIDTVYDLALGFWHKGKKLMVDVSAALGYAMQLLCSDPEAHRLLNHPELWASDDEGRFRGDLPDGTPWVWRDALGTDAVKIRPAMIHLPRSKELLARLPTGGTLNDSALGAGQPSRTDVAERGAQLPSEALQAPG